MFSPVSLTTSPPFEASRSALAIFAPRRGRRGDEGFAGDEENRAEKKRDPGDGIKFIVEVGGGVCHPLAFG